MSSTPIIVIGNGIAGTTLARQLRKRSQQPILVISKESDYFFANCVDVRLHGAFKMGSSLSL